jgi:hypothetical protein
MFSAIVNCAASGRIARTSPNRNALFACAVLLAWNSLPTGAAELATPLVRAHSHNDYLHERPLADALASGFWSVEADIWLTNGALLVAHDLEKTSPERTLRALYLEPLRSYMRTNRIVRGASPFTLLIDLKSAAEPAYAALREELRDYSGILTRFESSHIHTNAVMVVLSGNRPFEMLMAERVRFAALDGRLPDLTNNPPVALVPLVSDNWAKHFTWRGQGPMPGAERARLRLMVRQAHGQGRRIRFWGAPDHEGAWRELHREGVDLLNTDRLGEMEQFLRRLK